MRHGALGLALRAYVVLVMVTLCGCGAVATGEATLELSMHLPDGVEGYVTVAGPDGEERVYTRSAQWRGIDGETYVVRAEEVVVSGIRYFPFPAMTSVTLSAAARTTVTITYGLAAGGHLVPDDEPAAIRPGSRAFHVDCVAGVGSLVGVGVGAGGSGVVAAGVRVGGSVAGAVERVGGVAGGGGGVR